MEQILLQISSARGPIECCLVVAQLLKILIADAVSQGFTAAVIEEEPGAEKDTLQSALIHISGENCQAFAVTYTGTIQWIANSPFRPGHRRKNWFVGVSQVAVPKSAAFKIQDVRIETMKASGPGGQHVNTTESAVRAVHIPTGLTVVSSDERSQTANRKRATERLAILVARREEHLIAKAQKKRWNSHNDLVRGNPVRVYEAGNLK